METTTKPTAGFWIISIMALVWNIMGVMQYLVEQYEVESFRAMLTDEQLALIDGAPAWSTALFAIAVFGGFLGSLYLLLRKKWATPIFLISFICILVNMGYSVFATNHAEVFGMVQGVIMPVIIALIGLFLYFYSKRSAAKGWLN